MGIIPIMHWNAGAISTKPGKNMTQYEMHVFIYRERQKFW